MPFEFSCEHCGNKIRTELLRAGDRAHCPKCGRNTTVPNFDGSRPSQKLTEDQKQAVFDKWAPRAYGCLAVSIATFYLLARSQLSITPDFFRNLFHSERLWFGMGLVAFILPFIIAYFIFFYIMLSTYGLFGLINFNWQYGRHRLWHKKPFIYAGIFIVIWELIFVVIRLLN